VQRVMGKGRKQAKTEQRTEGSGLSCEETERIDTGVAGLKMVGTTDTALFPLLTSTTARLAKPKLQGRKGI